MDKMWPKVSKYVNFIWKFEAVDFETPRLPFLNEIKLSNWILPFKGQEREKYGPDYFNTYFLLILYYKYTFLSRYLQFYFFLSDLPLFCP